MFQMFSLDRSHPKLDDEGLIAAGAVPKIGAYRVMRNGMNVLKKPVTGQEVIFTGVRLTIGSAVITDLELEMDSLRYLRLIDHSGWVLDDSLINSQAPSLVPCGNGAIIKDAFFGTGREYLRKGASASYSAVGGASGPTPRSVLKVDFVFVREF